MMGHRIDSWQEWWENFRLQGHFFKFLCAYFGIHSMPILPQLQVKIPAILPNGVGGRLQPNTHAPCVRVVHMVSNKTVYWCMVV